MKRLAPLLALLVLLAMPGTASAKGTIEGMQVCGTDGCAPVSMSDESGAMGYRDLFRHPVESVSDRPSGAYYELRLDSDLAAETFLIAPDATAIRIETGFGSWVRTSDTLAARIRDASSGLTPYRFGAIPAAGGETSGNGLGRGAVWVLAVLALVCGGVIVRLARRIRRAHGSAMSTTSTE
jgi:hypothetical protein